MSDEYHLPKDKTTICQLLDELRGELDGPPAYLRKQAASYGYQGAAPAGSKEAGSQYQGTGLSTGPSGSPNSNRVNAIIGGLEACAKRVGRCLEDRVSNVDELRRQVGRYSSDKPSAQFRDGERVSGQERESCRKLLSHVAFWVRTAREVLSLTGCPNRTPRNGLVGLVQSATSPRRGDPPTYAVRHLLDETIYLLGKYATAPEEPAPDNEPMPYLGQRFNDRDAGIAEKVSLGNALKPRSLPTMYLPTKTYGIPEYPPKPMERAYYDRYKPPLNY